MQNPGEVYIDLASKVSFLEFIQDEFKQIDVLEILSRDRLL